MTASCTHFCHSAIRLDQVAQRIYASRSAFNLRQGEEVGLGTQPGTIPISALDPSGSGETTYFLPRARTDHIYKYGPAYVHYDIALLPRALKQPVAIFEGLRDDQREGLCYVARPDRRYLNSGRTAAARQDMVFLVTIANNGTIFQWRWEKADPQNRKFPINWEERFGSKRWVRR